MARLARLRADKRGAVAFETLMVILFMVCFFILPIADLVVAGVQYMSAYQALRDLGQYTQYRIPADVTTPSTWAASLPAVGGYTITAKLICGDAGAACSSSNTATPKYYTFATTITLAPITLSFIPALATLAGPHTVTYSERFQ